MKTITKQEVIELTGLGQFINQAIANNELTVLADNCFDYSQVETWFWSWK